MHEKSNSKVIINTGPDSHAEEENINIRAAVVHVVGDMLQSIGVIIASIIIKFEPSASIADPICTYLFSILVIVTTIPVFKDCLRVLMESSPQDVNVLELKSKIKHIHGVVSVDDIHVWMLAGSKNVMSCHVKIRDPSDREILRVHKEVSSVIDTYNICHKTI